MGKKRWRKEVQWYLSISGIQGLASWLGQKEIGKEQEIEKQKSLRMYKTAERGEISRR